jgi:extradiol dioxygenase family protein
MPKNNLPPFHLAIKVQDLTDARAFYGGLLGCEEGRSADSWVDFNFFGHQLVCHRVEKQPGALSGEASNPVDDHDVPVPHFGIVLDLRTWEMLSHRLKEARVEFIIEPHVRFKGQTGEQATMFFLDPSGNTIEFKAFRNVAAELFKK